MFSLLAISWVEHHYFFPQNEQTGIFELRVTSIEKSKKRFQSGYLYQGVIKKMVDNYSLNIPCRIYGRKVAEKTNNFKIEGTLYTPDGKSYLLKSKLPWQPLKATFTFAQRRFDSKNGLRQYIHQKYPSKKSARFLTALTTGIREDHILQKEFTELGLSHLLAISGFHFGILALLFHILLKRFLPFKIHAMALMMLCTAYAFFLGFGPSIERAWLFSICLFGMQLVERRQTALNTLGFVMLVSLLIHPLNATSLSFQLTFLATGAIFVLYPPCNRLFCKAIPLPPLLPHLVRYFRNALALTVAVNVALLPLLFLYFHKFSVHSLFYNLFFPPLVALSLIGFVIASLLDLCMIPWLHLVNNWVTQRSLLLLESHPLYEYNVYVESFGGGVATCYFLVLFLVMVWQKSPRSKIG